LRWVVDHLGEEVGHGLIHCSLPLGRNPFVNKDNPEAIEE
jgi:hypothetical protein